MLAEGISPDDFIIDSIYNDSYEARWSPGADNGAAIDSYEVVIYKVRVAAQGLRRRGLEGDGAVRSLCGEWGVE